MDNKKYSKVQEFARQMGWTEQDVFDLFAEMQQNQEADRNQNASAAQQNEDKSLELRVTNLINEFGIPANIMGYRYIRTAIMLLVEDFELINAVTKILYPQVAKIYKTTSTRVERAIRHAIELAWERGNMDMLEGYFGYSISCQKGKPTNSQFLSTLADRVRQENAK